MSGAIEITLEHAQFLAKHLSGCDPEHAAIAVLMEMGVATNRDGFDYLIHAIVEYMKMPTQKMTKAIYPKVGKRYQPPAGSKQVEQSIRSAIEAAWEKRDESIWICYFRPQRNGYLEKPSNGEFITGIAYFLKLWQGCCGKEAGCGTKEWNP